RLRGLLVGRRLLGFPSGHRDYPPAHHAVSASDRWPRVRVLVPSWNRWCRGWRPTLSRRWQRPATPPPLPTRSRGELLFSALVLVRRRVAKRRTPSPVERRAPRAPQPQSEAFPCRER